jgi:hypothetical protein
VTFLCRNGVTDRRFRGAIGRENLVAAELNARMMGNVSLVDALELTALVTLKDPRQRS